MSTLIFIAGGLTLAFLTAAALEHRGFRRDERRRDAPRVGYGRRARDKLFS